jgi:hypothetical protein
MNLAFILEGAAAFMQRLAGAKSIAAASTLGFYRPLPNAAKMHRG